MHTATKSPAGKDNGTAEHAAATAVPTETKVKRTRKAVVGHVIKFVISDETEFEKLTQLAQDDSRSADNFALLLVRKALKAPHASAS